MQCLFYHLILKNMGCLISIDKDLKNLFRFELDNKIWELEIRYSDLGLLIIYIYEISLNLKNLKDK